MAERDAYTKAGVDYGVIDPGKLLAQRTALATAKNLAPHGARELEESRGESAYVLELGDRLIATVSRAMAS